MEGWHATFNDQFRTHHPPLSTFIHVMQDEDSHWRLVVQEYENSPANGVRGKGIHRKSIYVEQDENLSTIYATRHNREPFRYLKAIAHRMPNPD